MALSVSLLALLHPAFAVVSVGLAVLTHQIVEAQMRAKTLSVRRTVDHGA